METQKPPNKKALLLVIDDEPLMTDLFSKFMIRLGFEVISTSSGKDALDFLVTCSTLPDIVITDMSMPEMNGVEIARILVTTYPNIPVIIDTGFASSDEISDLPVNVAAVVQKPFQYKVLADKINAILNPI